MVVGSIYLLPLCVWDPQLCIDSVAVVNSCLFRFVILLLITVALQSLVLHARVFVVCSGNGSCISLCKMLATCKADHYHEEIRGQGAFGG